MNDLSEILSNSNMDTSSMTAIIEEELIEEELIEEDTNLSSVLPSGPVSNMKIVDNMIVLSPMSEITLRVSDQLVLNDNDVSTPTTAKARSRFDGEL